MATPPTGTVTFFFSDIEGSTRLLERLGSDYADLLEPRDRRGVGAEADVLRERPELNRDLAVRDAPARAVRSLRGRRACNAQA